MTLRAEDLTQWLYIEKMSPTEAYALGWLQGQLKEVCFQLRTYTDDMDWDNSRHIEDLRQKLVTKVQSLISAQHFIEEHILETPSYSRLRTLDEVTRDPDRGYDSEVYDRATENEMRILGRANG